MEPTLSVMDIEQKRFSREFRGYDKNEVHQFLTQMARDWEHLKREIKSLKESIHAQEQKIERLQENEKALNQTIITAQKMTEEINRTAKKESDVIIGQAELQAEKILGQAHTRLTQVIARINEIKSQQAEFEGSLRGIIETHLRLLNQQKIDVNDVYVEDIKIFPKASSDKS
ncbi:MAG: DivIVA domain-containing protein [Bdellovibrionota bacterium]